MKGRWSDTLNKSHKKEQGTHLYYRSHLIICIILQGLVTVTAAAAMTMVLMAFTVLLLFLLLLLLSILVMMFPITMDFVLDFVHHPFLVFPTVATMMLILLVLVPVVFIAIFVFFTLLVASHVEGFLDLVDDSRHFFLCELIGNERKSGDVRSGLVGNC